MASLRRDRRNKINKNKFNLFLDIALVVAFVLDMEFHFTGLSLHELIGLVLGVFILLHLMTHWQWIISITVNFFRKFWHESRLNYVLNVALFVDMGALIVTGILISRTLGLNLSLDRGVAQQMEHLHVLTSDLALIIVALHVGLHWKWIATQAGKYLFGFKLPRLQAQSEQASVPAEEQHGQPA